MALKKTIARLNDYYDRLNNKKAKQIKESHVEKVIEKLQAKAAELSEAQKSATKPDKKDRLKEKKKVVADQIERAKFLLAEIRKAK